MYLPDNAHILDLGCGSGRDSKTFIQKGYTVTAIDGSKELCKLACEYIEQDVICKEFTEIDYINKFDGVWACASLLHLPSNELKQTFHKIKIALKNNGHFYTCFKYGEREEWRDGRYFNDMTESKLQQFIIDFEVVELFRKNNKWINIILKK
jgi:SAM-dependent methyltransferase